MYITVTAQKVSKNGSQSVAKFVDYLEKENIDMEPGLQEHFFDQNNDKISPENVTKEIDANTKKLKKVEPKFYSLTINPSQRELNVIGNDKDKLRAYTREIMKEYAGSFQNEINGRKVDVSDIKYYAKIETARHYKGRDKEVIQNAPFREKLKDAERQLERIERGQIEGDPNKIKLLIENIHAEAPYKIDGKMIEQGMKKEGFQNHIHIIVSRKDASNNFSLSPGSKYKSSTAKLNGKEVKRGFDRDGWISKSEKTFDKMFDHHRNYVLSYEGKKDTKENPGLYWEKISQLPKEEKKEALRILGMPAEKSSNIGYAISKRAQMNLQNTIKKVVVPDEIKEAMSKIDSVRTGRIPNTKMSIAQINGYIKDAKKIINLFSKGVPVPEPTTQAAQLVLKYAVKLGKALSRGSGIELGM